MYLREVGANVHQQEHWHGLMLTPHTQFNIIFDDKNVIMCMIYDHFIGVILLAVDLFQVCLSSGLMSVKQL